jgi:hypothetical protein
MNQSLETVLAELKKLEDYSDRQGGATEEEIKAVETSLGVHLPSEYRDFLRLVGYADWFGNEIFGIRHEQACDVIYKTNYARQEELPPDFLPIPQYVVVIGRYGGGGWHILHGMESATPGRVDLILDETFNEPDQSWPSFISFVWDWYLSPV